MNLLDTWDNLPTWGKWGIGLGGAGLLLLIWQPWKKSNTGSGTGTLTTSLESGTPYYGGATDGSSNYSGSGGYVGYPSLPSGGNTDSSGGGTGQVDPTGGTNPGNLTPTSKPTAYNGNTYFAKNPNQVQQAIGTVQSIMQKANVTPGTDQNSPLHQAKVQVASSVGVKVTDSGYAFDQNDNLVKVMSPGATGYTGGYKDTNNPYEQIQIINQTVASNGWDKLSTAQQNNLHQAKLNAVQALHETVDSRGIVHKADGSIDTRLSAGY